MQQLEYCKVVSECPAHLREQAEELLNQEIAFVDSREFREGDACTTIQEAISIARSWKQRCATTLPAAAPLFRVCQHPLLSKQQERILFFGMNALKFKANSLRASLNLANLDAKAIEGCIGHLRDANLIRDMLVSSNVRLVLSIVRDFQCSFFDNDELASDGIDALIRATEKFDFSRGFRFSTYATTVVSRHFGRIAKNESRRRTRFTTAVPDSFDLFGALETDNSLLQESTSSSMASLLQSMMQSLDDRERLILRRRFGFDTCEAKPTLSSIATEFGVCKERIRQLESRALKKMRKMCNDKFSSELKAELTPVHSG